jgi:exonuclease III
MLKKAGVEVPIKTTIKALLLSWFLFSVGCGQIASPDSAPSEFDNDLDRAQIGSFNLKQLSDDNKNWKRIADLVQESGVHLFSAQEVMSSTGAFNLLEALNTYSDHNWEMDLSKAKTGTSFYQEYFAFYYRVDSVKSVTSNKRFCDTKFASHVESNTCYWNDSTNDEFNRDPFVGHYQVGSGKFTLIAVHLFYGSASQEDLTKRRDEMMALRDVSDHVRQSTPSADVVVLGDFNLSLEEDDLEDDKVRAKVPSAFYSQSPKMEGLVDGVTTIGGSSFDHFFHYKNNKYLPINNSWGSITDFNTDSQTQKDKYRTQISDHFLVKAAFDLLN